MKTLKTSAWKLGSIAILAALVGIAIYGKRTATTLSQPPSGIPALPTETSPSSSPVQQSPPETNHGKPPAIQQVVATAPPAPQPPEPSWTTEQSVDILVSPRATYSQRQASWKRLNDPEQLDRAIADLEDRVKNNPQVADYSAVLGTAYLRKAGLSKDMRDQAMLGMKADQTFDAALAADPNNWDARYMKAVGMSYWPSTMNKGKEVLERFTSLIQDQEQQPAQPQFSQTYVRLGDEYRKAGQLEYAQQVWQRGAAQFPDDAELKRKLASLQ
jgi:tetratricopeptide (TPR) repeat protein